MTDYGTHTQQDGHDVLTFERRLAHSVDAVWAAVTRPEEFTGWLGEADIDLRVGGAFEFRWLNSPTSTAGTVSALQPPHLVEYDSDKHGVLRFELREDGAGGCLLRFVCTMQGLDAEQLASNLAGWDTHLDFLEEALAGKPFDWTRWDAEGMPRWQARYDHGV